MRKFLKHDNVDEAKRSLEEFRAKQYKPLFENYRMLIESLAKKGKPEEALEILNEAKKDGNRVDASCYVPIIEHYIISNQKPEAQKVIKIMEEEGIMPNEHIAYLVSNHMNEVKKQIELRDILNHHLSRREYEKAYTQFQEFRSKGVIPVLENYKLLMTELAKYHPYLYIDGLLWNMVEDKVKEDYDLFVRICKGMTSIGEIERVKKLMDRMKRYYKMFPGLEIWLPIVKYYMKKGNLENARRTIQEMEREYIPFNDEAKAIKKKLGL